MVPSSFLILSTDLHSFVAYGFQLLFLSTTNEEWLCVATLDRSGLHSILVSCKYDRFGCVILVVAVFPGCHSSVTHSQDTHVHLFDDENILARSSANLRCMSANFHFGFTAKTYFRKIKKFLLK